MKIEKDEYYNARPANPIYRKLASSQVRVCAVDKPRRGLSELLPHDNRLKFAAGLTIAMSSYLGMLQHIMRRRHISEFY